MPSCCVHVIVGDNDGWCFQITSATFAQVAYVRVFYFAEVDSYQGEIVLPDSSQEVVDTPRLQHTMVLLRSVDSSPARVGKVAC